MNAIVRGYVPSRFGQVHYRIVPGPDDAPPLLCLHQTPSNGADFEPIMEPLSQGRTVIALDTPGYGMSDAPPEPVSIEELATVADTAMRDLAARGELAEGPYDVLGFHTGSLLSTELARSRPERVRRVVVFGLAAYEAEVRAAKLANLRGAFPRPGPTLEHVEKLWAIIGTLSDPRIGYEERHVAMAECLRLGERMPWGYISVYRYDFLGAMAEVEQPVLVMNPEDDLWQVTRATSHLFRNGRRVDWPGVAHGVLKLERERVVAVIAQFLGDQAAD
ncbi:alpha/beta fold hydrolase [Novosphingobium profundi]|uniref:alpha/beta fold hydrolase n=1 Tax=Novosphingobium profundi TaxID=1774954 RepID=UPI001BDA49F5|nr:alpha/beta fold hydrolase [Novosphingobium profundi]MBT0669541.1 alpha/beta fold hydrolase [Novosphingobium profundi]